MAITISFNQDTGSISVEDYNFKKIERHKGKSLLDFPKNYIVIDIETTGLDTSIDSIIEIGAIKVVNNSGKLEFVVTSGSFNSNSQVTTGTGVTGLDAQDTVTAELTNEKIPTYQVSVKKFAKEEDTTLKGAQYKITGEGIDEKGATYTTDDTGVLTIPNLYEYVEGKNITGVYTLQEITPPEGSVSYTHLTLPTKLEV